MIDKIVFDNFLDKNEFNLIKQDIIDNKKNFPWFINEINNNLHFIHTFYNEDGTNSKFFYMLHPIIHRLTAKKFFRIKASLDPATEDHKVYSSHVDIKDCITGIYYINSNNGYTIFKDDDKIDSVENRMLLFNSNQEYSQISCTDEKAKYYIKFEYIN